MYEMRIEEGSNSNVVRRPLAKSVFYNFSLKYPKVRKIVMIHLIITHLNV